MRITTRKSAFAAICMATALASSTSAATLTTPLAGGNENDGVMFDVQTGANALTLTSIGVDIFGTASYQIFYKPGSITNSITSVSGVKVSDPLAWTLLGSFNDVVGIGTVSAQPGGTVPFSTNLALDANSTYGLYITQTVNNFGIGSGVRFTNSVLGSTVAANDDLTILNSRGAADAFTAISNNGRSFNGSLTYAITAAVPEPSIWALMIVGFGAAGFALRRQQNVRATFA